MEGHKLRSHRKPPRHKIKSPTMMCEISNIVASFVFLGLILAAQSEQTSNTHQMHNQTNTNQNKPNHFLSGATGGEKPIVLVNGFSPKRPQEEEMDGFIMQARNELAPESSAQAAINAPKTTTNLPHDAVAGTPSDEATTFAAFDGSDQSTGQSGQQEAAGDSEQRIPIDANRQQYATHDQLNLVNASTKDETIQSVDEQAADKSPRSSQSVMQQLSSFLLGEYYRQLNLSLCSKFSPTCHDPSIACLRLGVFAAASLE